MRKRLEFGVAATPLMSLAGNEKKSNSTRLLCHMTASGSGTTPSFFLANRLAIPPINPDSSAWGTRTFPIMRPILSRSAPMRHRPGRICDTERRERLWLVTRSWCGTATQPETASGQAPYFRVRLSSRLIEMTWDRARIVANLRKRGLTLSGVARAAGLYDDACRYGIDGHSQRGAEALAKAIGVPFEEMFGSY